MSVNLSHTRMCTLDVDLVVENASNCTSYYYAVHTLQPIHTYVTANIKSIIVVTDEEKMFMVSEDNYKPSKGYKAACTDNITLSHPAETT